MRSAFTLIEVMVALVIFAFGMLALAATTAAAARDLAVANRRVTAHAAATHRVELLRASACTASGSGTAAAPGIWEYWRVEAAGSRRTITDSVEFLLPHGRRSILVLRASTLCG